jgi:hypothetical protein
MFPSILPEMAVINDDGMFLIKFVKFNISRHHIFLRDMSFEDRYQEHLENEKKHRCYKHCTGCEHLCIEGFAVGRMIDYTVFCNLSDNYSEKLYDCPIQRELDQQEVLNDNEFS